MSNLLTWSGVLQDKVFIIELAAVNGLAPGAVVVGEVATLAHKLRDDAMEAAALVPKAFLMCAQAAEVLYRSHGGRCGTISLESYTFLHPFQPIDTHLLSWEQCQPEVETGASLLVCFQS